ncbi:lipopolysaccharide assembly protein LapA domain-containing protein [Rheinheimera sp.]|uniref:lipopolysaccharide assembly protein LapA domain-containing protein n=1 Tax=Rheinheimera sp. TaxID=1869214 RepID=UPI0026108F78|nr:lipopolysaccharide assembly protein LapA domain-containing protein [Rheinheimera sp.]MCA1930920.1 DUF1049 domain-containing protein [Rheinheimera sp.]
MTRFFYVVIIIALIIFGLVLGSLNQQVAEFNYLIAKAELRVVDIAALFLVSGFLLGLSVSMAFILKAKTKGWFTKSFDKT